MVSRGSVKRSYPKAKNGAEAAKLCADSPQTRSSSYTLAYQDHDFLLRDDLRALRLELELLKPELILEEFGVNSTIVIFGSSRIMDLESAKSSLEESRSELARDPSNATVLRKARLAERAVENSRYYEEARKLARIISERCRNGERLVNVVTTGGGPGIMEAANRGAHDAGEKNIGFNIVLPFEQAPNPYITPELCFQFHYFAIRKMHFLMRARALIVFPGGFGTMDELFETLTLVQTQKIDPMPILLFGKSFWQKLINFDFFVEEGMISPRDLDLFKYVETAEEAWKIIQEYAGNIN
jgi:uncharacterized protein (TIGR00730 family)